MPQLIIKQYNQYGANLAHCLIYSTAPNNAENQSRVDEIYPIKKDEDEFKERITEVTKSSLTELSKLKSALKGFIESEWERTKSVENILNKINIIIEIHGFNVTLAELEENTYFSLKKKFEDDSKKQQSDDFVLFINFSWPSEQAIASQLVEWFKAMPIIVWILLTGVILMMLLNFLPLFGLIIVLGIILCLVFLRLVVYFRDRDRASNYGVYDAVELVRWIPVILREIVTEIINEKDPCLYAAQSQNSNPNLGTANLSFIAHSMGGFVATQTIRVLSDVFDPASIERWKKISSEGPFGLEKMEGLQQKAEKDPALQIIGKNLKLKSLILVSPDIPIWAITTSRSNTLTSCLRRFEEAYLFTNNADMVLRLASTVANYFTFPSNTQVGGYRLGNLTSTRERSYSKVAQSGIKLGVRAFFRNINLGEDPFNSTNDLADYFTIVDCTDYKDNLVSKLGTKRRLLSVMSANNNVTNMINYILTTISHFLFPKNYHIDSHGGYYNGVFCRDLLYALAFYNIGTAQRKLDEKYKKDFYEKLEDCQISWIER